MMSASCSEVRELLLSSWVDGPPADLEAIGGSGEPCRESPEGDSATWEAAGGVASLSAAEHFRTCPACRREAMAIRRLDRWLARGFSSLAGVVDPPSDELVHDTVRRVREVAPEVKLIRRLRRPIRIILWGVFYAFTLLACSALAVALWKALRAQ